MKTYRVAPSVRWSVGRTNLTVADGRGSVCTFDYPDAAVWDLLTRGYRYDDVVRLTAYIGALSAAEAAAVVRRALERWRDAGLIEER